MMDLIGIAAPVLLGAVAVWFLARRIDAVHKDVVTIKGQATIGTLSSQTETRRVEAIPQNERTAIEQRHLDSAALEEAPHPESD